MDAKGMSLQELMNQHMSKDERFLLREKLIERAIKAQQGK